MIQPLFLSTDTSGKGEALPFEKMCQCFEALTMANVNRFQKEGMMMKLWTQYGKGVHDIFPLMRLTLPHLDTERPNYKLKHKNLARKYVDLLSLPDSSDDAQKMLNWKKPSAGFTRNEQGNFPEVVYSVIKGRCTVTKGHITVGEVNALLDELAQAQNLEAKERVLMKMHTTTTAQEQRWLLRIILKDMHIGMKEDSILTMLHADAKELYNSVCDLHQTCLKCADPSYRLDQISVELFKPFKPRLAHKADYRTVHKEMYKKGDYVAEYKLDGERVVLHFRRGDGAGGSARAEWWTRNCHNFTHQYGEALAPVLAECLSPELRECILDGEMMVWNQATGDYAPFGENRSLAGDYKRDLQRDGYQPCYIVFDVVWLNGKGLASLPMRERRELLRPYVRWKAHSMQLSEQVVVEPHPQGKPPSEDHTIEIMNWLDRAMAKGYEGVMLKSLNAPYVPGSRDTDWQKLKPDYVHDMGDDLELLILAGYYGEGVTRNDGISTFLCGVRAPSSERAKLGVPPDMPLFYPFAKVGSGYTHEALVDLRSQLKSAERPWHKSARPLHLCGWIPNKTDDEPHVWYEPTLSKVMQVAAYEIVKGDAFMPAGLTLRFPRLARLRDDKGWADVERFEELQRRVAEGKSKVAASKRSAAEVARADAADLEYGGQAGKRSKPSASKLQRSKVGVVSHAAHDLQALSRVAREFEVLRSHVAVVKGVGGSVASIEELLAKRREWQAAPEGRPTPTLSADALKRLLKQLGAERVDANVNKETTLVVDADPINSMSMQTKNLVADCEKEQRTQFNVVAAEWLVQCFLEKQAGQEAPPLEPLYVRYATPDTRDAMGRIMDEWGDRYQQLATADSLKDASSLVKRRTLLGALGARPSVASAARSGGGTMVPCHGGATTSGVGGPPVACGGSTAMTAAAGASSTRSVAEVEAMVLGYLDRLEDDRDLAELRRGPTRMLLSRVVAYAPSAAVRLRLRLAGAAVVSDPEAPGATVTHAVLAPSAIADGSCARVRAALTRARLGATQANGMQVAYAYILSEAWLDACERAEQKVGEAQYLLREAA